LIVGAMVGNIIPFLTGVLNHAPWGGLIVLPVVEGKLWYVLAVVVGSLVTAIMVNLLKKENHDKTEIDAENAEDIELSFEEF
ncbi:MAG: PTS fructose transporter subunit IIC, partial [Eubacterium sp.]